MVHSTFAQGHVMGGRDTSPLGIPKSPSFHSGLDLVASASVDSLVAAQTTSYIEQLAGKGDFIFDDTSKLNKNEVRPTKDNMEKTDNNFKGNTKLQFHPQMTLPVQKNTCAVRVLQNIGSLPSLAGKPYEFIKI